MSSALAGNVGISMLIFAIVAALATAAATSADPPTSVAPADVKTAKAEDPYKVICKAQPMPGSRMAARVCATREQWARNEEASRQMLRDAQAKSQVGDSGPPTGMRIP